MSVEMVLAKIDESLGRRCRWSREDLWVDMTAELLNSYLIESRFREYFNRLSVHAIHINQDRYVHDKLPVAAPTSED